MFMKCISRSDISLLNSLHWVNNNVRHRRSTTFMSNNRKCVQTVCDDEVNMCKQTRLSNKHAQTNEEVEHNFQDRVEVELQKNKYNVFSLMLRVCQSENKIESYLPEENLTT